MPLLVSVLAFWDLFNHELLFLFADLPDSNSEERANEGYEEEC